MVHLQTAVSSPQAPTLYGDTPVHVTVHVVQPVQHGTFANVGCAGLWKLVKECSRNTADSTALQLSKLSSHKLYPRCLPLLSASADAWPGGGTWHHTPTAADSNFLEHIFTVKLSVKLLQKAQLNHFQCLLCCCTVVLESSVPARVTTALIRIQPAQNPAANFQPQQSLLRCCRCLCLAQHQQLPVFLCQKNPDGTLQTAMSGSYTILHLLPKSTTERTKLCLKPMVSSPL